MPGNQSVFETFFARFCRSLTLPPGAKENCPVTHRTKRLRSVRGTPQRAAGTKMDLEEKRTMPTDRKKAEPGLLSDRQLRSTRNEIMKTLKTRGLSAKDRMELIREAARLETEIRETAIRKGALKTPPAPNPEPPPETQEQRQERIRARQEMLAA
jgi:hypothetical protein